MKAGPCRSFRALSFASLLLGFAAQGRAQTPAVRDSVFLLDGVVVTADRATTPLVSSSAAVTVLTGAQLARLPHVTLADALTRIPGFALVDFDGLGHDPQLMVRGFYGGGEAEYVVVMVDGKPLNNVQTGLVPWDAIPLAAIDRVEIVRGGASALWGDAAVGSVINVITRDPAVGSTRWSASGGSYGSWSGSADAHTRIGDRSLALFGGLDRTDGFRANAERTTGRAGATLDLASGARGSLRLSALSHWRDFDVPGPLPGAVRDADPASSDPFFRFDRTEDRSHRLGIDGDRSIGSRATLSASITGELRETESVRTIALAPEFADTQERALRTGRGLATVQLSLDETPLPVRDRLVVGADASFGTLDSEHYKVLTGGRDAYLGGGGARGDLDASGLGDRATMAAFAHYTLIPVDAVRITVGARADWLRDSFDPRTPAADTAMAADHGAFSPKLGVNVRYVDGAANRGHVYATASRSFKAPTLDQLFDQRRLPVSFPPFAISTSNALLEPQHGTNVEAGIYHGATLLSGRLAAELSLSVYRMDMEDELDFDLETLRYVNIGRSRHSGVEAGLVVDVSRTVSAFVNYTLQDATSRAGEYSGNRLKAIPRHFATGGFSATVRDALEAGFAVSHARDSYLDDANTVELPAYTRVDARISYPVAGVRLFLDVGNVFDATYSTTGFPDPSGTDVIYFHPAAGRTFSLGLRGGF